ncbi:MAG: glycosyl transferase, group 1 [Pseudarthrobacter sp.]|nr:glycosyl transferase, group 1 [Pseudarthrobacter sp.]
MTALEPIVWIAGTSWDGVAGTDKCLVSEFAKSHPVLWVDPPDALMLLPALRTVLAARDRALTLVARNIWRLRVPPMRGAARPIIRTIKAALLDRAVTSALRELDWEPQAVVVAHAFTTFPQVLGGRKVYFVTDDWLEGAALMGVARRELERVLQLNLSQADAVAAVSESLLTRLRKLLPALARDSTVEGPVFKVIPNGCPQVPAAPYSRSRLPTACLVGQLNERLDIEVLEALQASGVSIIAIGPRTDRNPIFKRRLDRFLAADNVQWLGRMETVQVQRQLSLAGVGITPYADLPFNRASFPLKTLEYLAAGLATVSTDTPSARWLDTDLIALRSNPHEFSEAVMEALEMRNDKEQELRRREFASGHSWAVRVLQFQELLIRPSDHHVAEQSPQEGEDTSL